MRYELLSREVEHDLTVGGRLENGAVANQFFTQDTLQKLVKLSAQVKTAAQGKSAEREREQSVKESKPRAGSVHHALHKAAVTRLDQE